MERMILRVFVVAALLLAPMAVLNGCAVNPTTGKQEVVVPNTPDQALYAAYATLTEVRRLANKLALSGVLSLGELETVDVELKAVRADLTLAEGYFKGGSGWQASRIIDAAMVVLYRIQSELREKANGAQ